jgi:hypothetical protein
MKIHIRLQEIFFPLLPPNVQTSLRPTKCVSEISRSEREAYHSPPANAQVKNKWRCASTSTCYQVVHRDNLTFTLPLPSHSVSHLCVIKHTSLNIRGSTSIIRQNSKLDTGWTWELSFILEKVIRRERTPRIQKKRTGGFQSWSGSGREESSSRFC